MNLTLGFLFLRRRLSLRRCLRLFPGRRIFCIIRSGKIAFIKKFMSLFCGLLFDTCFLNQLSLCFIRKYDIYSFTLQMIGFALHIPNGALERKEVK